MTRNKEGERTSEGQAAGLLVHLLTLCRPEPTLLKIEIVSDSQLDQPGTVLHMHNLNMAE